MWGALDIVINKIEKLFIFCQLGFQIQLRAALWSCKAEETVADLIKIKLILG